MNLITVLECVEYVIMKPAKRQDDGTNMLSPSETTAQEKDHEMTADLMIIEQAQFIMITFPRSLIIIICDIFYI